MVKMSFEEVSQPLTAEELREVIAAERKPPLFDEDSPEMTADMLAQFKRLNRTDRTRQTVSLRLSPSTLKKAKAYGKGYTSFLSRLLDEAIQDDAMVKKCL